ncbi:hypothetical protein JHK82_028923 [Glycine max]|uniref:Uncharacterized protein n=2 Tax=Glycine subgen. Soja TaxID=1462606 RepID=K7LKW5_SOYBN|nr:hypothetical protein JHK87_028838 [Glycine soja]KAG4998145.1 hypothetical protein JHK85_029584 [Glycine max]KAG5004904.1 hypothetical protein JHK86_029043 [Glycine max]KAG5128088.1 hypothetical protein JHK82_028923 [Glycine max]KAG5152694.1 hypothetical protein JHK84_029166 [Glycine max]
MEMEETFNSCFLHVFLATITPIVNHEDLRVAAVWGCTSTSMITSSAHMKQHHNIISF